MVISSLTASVPSDALVSPSMSTEPLYAIVFPLLVIENRTSWVAALTASLLFWDEKTPAVSTV